MPSHDIFSYFAEDLEVEQSWEVNGSHYAKTCNLWLQNHYKNKNTILDIFTGHYPNTRQWYVRWQLFFLACEELFAYNEGKEWFVSHYLLVPKKGVNMKDFKDKVAVITGAGSGIGRGLSLHAASLGMRLVLADINQDGLAETMDLVSEHEVEAIARKVDVASSVSVESLAGETFEHFQNCHLLFNNAGVLGPGAIKDTNEEQFKWLMDINIGGCYNGIKAF